VAAGRLAEDFRAHREEYVATQAARPASEWRAACVSYYDDYTRLCEIATDGGLIDFC
jgi:hypothetical protein